MAFDTRAVGVFDSGLGGLTSVREIERTMPQENLVYFGDTGRVPYGTRSPETILKYAFDDLHFLESRNVKAVLIACGTVSSIALGALSDSTELPIVGVVRPASERAAALAFSDMLRGGKAGRIAVLGTPATAKNGAYEREICAVAPQAQVLPVACPLFVPLVENGYVAKDDPLTLLAAKEYVEKLKAFQPSCLILGCTHYPLIRETIESACETVLGYVPLTVDAGASAVATLGELLRQKGLCAPPEQKGKAAFFVSDETHNFGKTASAFLGRTIEDVTRVDIERG